ncbi:unnamed protein product [Schistosoma turkestanicum]|nr:unnamed protein product [Schistosoma turkestanicum]
MIMTPTYLIVLFLHYPIFLLADQVIEETYPYYSFQLAENPFSSIYNNEMESNPKYWLFTNQELTTPDEYFTTATTTTPKWFTRKEVGINSDIENNEDNIILPRNKEDKINSLRNVLLRQSLTDSSVYQQNDDRLYSGNQLQETNTVLAERVRLLTMKEQLAKEAANTSTRFFAREKQSPYNKTSD